MKRPSSPSTRLRLAVLVGASAVAMGAPSGAPASRASVWDDLRARVGSLLGTRSTKRQEALDARQKANALDAKADAARSKLVAAQRTLLDANQSYFQVWSQVKKTEATLIRERHRRFLIAERYNRRRILFGRRLAAMQRTGSMNYMQIFLGSRTLSDITRRAHLFRALMERDADLQSQLRADKAELDRLNTDLAAQWSRRNALRQDAYRERQRIANATKTQQSELTRLVNSRDALQAFAAQRVGEMKALNQAVYDYNARAQAQAFAQAREDEAEERASARRAAEAEASRRETRWIRRRYAVSARDDSSDSSSRARSSYSTRRRYSQRYERPSTYRRSARRDSGGSGTQEPRVVRVRVAERVTRVRQVPTFGGTLSPMSIPEIVFREKSVPISSGSGVRSGPTARSETQAADDFPASDP